MRSLPLSDLLNLYAAKRLKAASPNTLRLYQHSLRSFARTLGRTATLADLNDDDIERHMWRIVNGGGSPASANKDRGQLIALWRFAFDRRMVNELPDNRALIEPERVPMGWLPEELHKLLNTIEKLDGWICNVPCALWWRALVHVLLDTGERIGAIRYLEKSAVQDRWLLVPAHLRKGRRRDRLYPLTEDTLAALVELMAINKHTLLLFPWDRCDNYIYNRYKVILSDAGLPTDSRSKFHRIRRTVASAVAREGGDATAAMDHSSPRTTKKYLDPRIVQNEPVNQVLARYLANPKLCKRPTATRSKRLG